MNLNYFGDSRLVKVIVSSKKFGSLISKLIIKSYFVIKKVFCIYCIHAFLV